MDDGLSAALGGLEHIGFTTFLIFMGLRVVLLLVCSPISRRLPVVWGVFSVLFVLYCMPEARSVWAGASLFAGEVSDALRGKVMGGVLAALGGTILCQNLGLE